MNPVNIISKSPRDKNPLYNFGEREGIIHRTQLSLFQLIEYVASQSLFPDLV